jgi:hypothetical protein
MDKKPKIDCSMLFWNMNHPFGTIPSGYAGGRAGNIVLKKKYFLLNNGK